MQLFSNKKPKRKLSPFPYQVEFRDAFEKARSDGFKRILGVLPTGGGKTVCMGEEIARLVEQDGRALVLAHTRKLVKQFSNSLTDNYGIHSTIEMGNMRAEESPVICSSVQTMQKRIDGGDFDNDEFDLVVIDEGHRALSPGYRKIEDYFGGHAWFAGITATPRRGDQRDLMLPNGFYDTKAIDVPLNRLINEGFLAPLTIVNFPLKIEVERASLTGDFTEQEVAHAIEPYLGECAKELSKYKGRCCLVFLPLIKTSQRFAAMLEDEGMRAKHVDGTMSEKDVERAIAELERGDIDVICNSMLLTEGVDIRPVNLILNLRLTTSWTLYMQLVGRGTRTFDPAKHGRNGCKWGLKSDCILLDPLWLCDRHNMLQRPATLVATDDKMAEEIDRKLKAVDEPLDLMEAQQQVLHDREETLRKRLEELAKRKSRQVNAMSFFLSMGRIDLAEYEPISAWESDDITPGQRNVLLNNNFDMEQIKGKGHASKIIDSIIERSKKGLATIKMAKFAESLGMENAWLAKFEEVKHYLDTNAKKITSPSFT